MVDSFGFPFQFIEDGSRRLALMSKALAILHSLISKRHIAIVLTNQMTTTFNLNSEEKTLVPCYGGRHLIQINQQIILNNNPEKPGCFFANINKALGKYDPGDVFEYRITNNGIE